jgi:hypothetical protein
LLPFSRPLRLSRTRRDIGKNVHTTTKTEDEQMAFNATWAPGPDAVAGMQNRGMHFDQPALVIYLDQECLAIMAPGGPATWPEFVRFLRQLRDGAEELAEFFDVQAKSAAERGAGL